MLTGRPPFEGTNAAAVAAQRLVSAPRPPRELNSAISPTLERVVLGALARDPGQRYAAAAFRDALRAAASGDQTLPLGTVPIPRSDPSNPSSQPSASAAWTAPPAAPRHSLPLWAWAIGGLLALLLVAWLLVGRAGLPASSAPGTVPVPNLVGRRLADVPTALKRAGLVAGEASTRVTDGPRVSTVIDQDPPADAAARSGDAVRVVVGVAR